MGKDASKTKPGETKMKNADEIKVIASLALATTEKAELEKRHTQEGKDAKELLDIEAGIMGWLVDNGWMSTIESEAAKGRARYTFTITPDQSVNIYAQGQIAASTLRALKYQAMVLSEEPGVKVLVDAIWS